MRVVVTVRAKPGARQPRIARAGDEIVVAVRERAIDGAANAAIVRAVAGWLGVPRGAVTLEAGATARVKRLAVIGITAAEFDAAVAGLSP